MKYQQRLTPPPQGFEPTEQLWVPTPVGELHPAVAIEPKESDHYVVVDELVEQRVRLVVTKWPRLDGDGRLSFSDDGEVADGPFDLHDLQERVEELRAEHGDLARPLRVGDTFLVRGPVGDPARWTLLHDVTGPAREEAKAALFRAAIPARADAVSMIEHANGADAAFAPAEEEPTLDTDRRARAARRREQTAEPAI